MAIMSTIGMVDSGFETLTGSGLTDYAGDIFGSSSSGDLPSPLPYSAAEVTAALQDLPRKRDDLRSYILDNGLCGGGPPEPSDCNRVRSSLIGLAEQALYLGDGAPGHPMGSGFTSKERTVRQKVQGLMDAWEAQGATQDSQTAWAGGAATTSTGFDETETTSSSSSSGGLPTWAVVAGTISVVVAAVAVFLAVR